MKRPKVECEECGRMVGNLAMHRKSHKTEHPVTTAERAPRKPKRNPGTDMSLEVMFARRNELNEELNVMSEMIVKRLESLGLTFKEDRATAISRSSAAA